MKKIFDMTKEDFAAVPYLDLWNNWDELVKDSIPIGKVGGGSDVLHLDGIGGYGDDREDSVFYRMVPVKGWSIDCLPKTGYLNLWTHRMLYLKDNFVGSSCEIYSEAESRQRKG